MEPRAETLLFNIVVGILLFFVVILIQWLAK